MGLLALAVVGGAFFGVIRLLNALAAGRTAKQQLSDTREALSDAKEKEIRVARETEQRIAQMKKDLQKKFHDEARAIISESSKGFPWLARALANYETLFDFQMGKHLETKKHPAHTSARLVKEISARSRQFREEYHIARSRIDYYEELFPWLNEYVDVDLDSLLEFVKKPDVAVEEADPVRFYLPAGEYDRLPPRQRNQMALDRYKSRRKSHWEIGRDYERFVGYWFENQGYSVQYHGIDEGLEDLGRDLIARKGEETRIVQCKYWSAHKKIHEKHIAQLFGTTVKFEIENGLKRGDKVRGLLLTSACLSEMAKSFATALDIDFKEQFALSDYPIIKCNIGRDEFGSPSKIYHLPMDQQYDKTRISKSGERYVSTVAEAEDLGFRRAWRWHGTDG